MGLVLALYVPVLHAGYLKFFEKHAAAARSLFIFGKDLIEEFTFLEKEIRAVDPGTMRRLIEGLGTFKEVKILDADSARELAEKEVEIITADEEISRRVAEKYFRGVKVIFDTVFLRWDEKSVRSEVVPKAARASSDPFDREMIARAAKGGGKSSDWWRRVGAVVVENSEVILEAHNQHVPSEHMPYIEGDPRDYVEAGVSPDIATSLHAEQAVVSEAARRGISLEGASVYLTVFPCALCAKLIAYSGIKKCFFASGHASLDSERVLRANRVELVLVK